MDPALTYIIFVSCLCVGFGLYRIVSYTEKWERLTKTGPEHHEAMMQLVINGTLVYFVSDTQNSASVWTMVSFFGMLFIFGALGQLDFAHTNLPSWREWRWQMWALASFALALILAAAGYDIWMAYTMKVLLRYLGELAFVVGWYVVAAVQWTLSRNTTTFYLHHTTLFMTLALFTRFDTLISQICSGLCLGIATQGVAAYSYPYAIITRKNDC